MKNLQEEIKACLEKTGSRQIQLSRLSGVPASTVCNLIHGKRRDVFGANLDALRRAMAQLYAEKGVVP